MKIPNILLACLLTANITTANTSCQLNSNYTQEMQRSMKRLELHKISFNWSNAQYQAKGDNEHPWQKLPALGEINKLSFCIKSPKRSGSFKLPKIQYLEFLNEYIEPCELLVYYRVETTGILRLSILDTFTDIDGLFSFKLYLKITEKNVGEAFGEIWIADSYKGKVRNIKFELIPLTKA